MTEQVHTEYLRAVGLAQLLEFDADQGLAEMAPGNVAKILSISAADAEAVIEFTDHMRKMPRFISEYARLIRESSALRDVENLSNEEIAAEIARIVGEAKIPMAEAFRHLLGRVSPAAAQRLISFFKCKSEPNDYVEQVTQSRGVWIAAINDIVENRGVRGGKVVIAENLSIGKSGD